MSEYAIRLACFLAGYLIYLLAYGDSFQAGVASALVAILFAIPTKND